MAGKLIRGRRMVLRPGVGEEEVAAFAAGLGYPRRADSPADEESGTPRQIIWHAENSPVVTYREDVTSGLPYVIVMAYSSADLREVTELAELVLHTWTLPDLLQAVDSTNDPEELGDALLQMGLGAPREFDEEFFSRVREGLLDGREDVVEAALVALTYEPWGEYVDPVNELLETAPGGYIEETATAILDRFREVGDDEE
ncbi:hypothetical protein [Streptomyces roseochromogenus]|nr:hypothetical protein [Streptomyces roseochromogenus]